MSAKADWITGVSYCCPRQVVKVGLPAADVPPLYTYDPVSRHHSGFLIELLNELQRNTLITFIIRQVDTESRSFYSDSSVLRSSLRSGEVDMVPAGKLAFADSAVFREEFFVTSPFEQTSYTGMVRRVVADSTMWRLFDPFSPDLWVGLILVLGVMALAVALLLCLKDWTHARQGGERVSLTRARNHTINSGYHMVALCLGGDDMDTAGQGIRVVRLAALLFGLVLTATYVRARPLATNARHATQLGGSCPTAARALQCRRCGCLNPCACVPADG